MGVSFKVARVGSRYKPKPCEFETLGTECSSVNDSQQRAAEGNLSRVGAKITDDSIEKSKNGLRPVLEELEVSFSMNLFNDGFSLGKPTESFSDVPKQLHPYDKASEELFSGIEYGCLPGDLLDDIPCKYVNGVLLCEIRDYRSCFPHTSPTGKSPIVHKVTLQMCMETVVKNILSMSNDSWTYKDILEIESCILKALQPDLQLNPEPLWDKLLGEPLRKKIDLGIAWSWKKRKLSDVPTCSLSNSESYLVKHSVSDSLIQKPSPQSDPVDKEYISSCFLNPQGISCKLDSMLPSCPVVVLNTPNVASVPNQLKTTAAGVPRVPSDRGICEKQAIRGLASKKPKKEPVELPQLQLLANPVNVTPAGPELQQMENRSSQPQHKVDKILCDREKSKLHSPVLIHNHQRVVHGVQNLLARAPSVKEEPSETSGLRSDCLSVDRRINQSTLHHIKQQPTLMPPRAKSSVKEEPSATTGLHSEYLSMDRRIDPSTLHHSKQQPKSTPLRTNSSSILTLQNHMAQSFDKNLKNGSATEKRKTPHSSQLLAEIESLLATTQNGNSLQRQIPIHVGQKNSHANGLGIKMADSVVTTNVTNANNQTVKSLPQPQPSTEVDFAIERFSKILRVAERKRKLDQFVAMKPAFHMIPPLVGFHLSSFDDSGRSKNPTEDKISPSIYPNGGKTRTVIFCHESHICESSGRMMVDRDALVKLVLSESPDLGTVDARVHRGCEEEMNSFSFPPLSTFPNTRLDVLATQFTSLMVHEGYRKIFDQADSSSCHKYGVSSIETPSVGNTISTAGTIKASSATWTSGSSAPISNSLSSRMPFHNPTPSPLPSIFPGVNLATSGKSLSSPQLSFSSKPQIDIVPQVRLMHQQQPQSANRSPQVLLQMHLRYRQEQELQRRKQSMGPLSAGASSQDIVLPDGGIHRMSGSGNNVIGIKRSAPILTGGLMHWLKNLSNINNLESHTSTSNGKQLVGMLSDHRLPPLPTPGTRQDLGRDLMSGVPDQSNASTFPVAKQDAFTMKYRFNNHQEPRDEITQQLQMIQQQETKPMRQLQVVPNSDGLVGSSMNPVNSLLDQQSQLRKQQLNPVSAILQMNPGNITGPESSAAKHNLPEKPGYSLPEW
ncbi:hypothetical protein L6164_001656 [Bauhinia variegata]|uniref:Uncharacterized protein n=1 Tax=Bauhinia variegata TaxID=167791 RepID=A0ACB9QCI6_BAUVA|nr:hypothetical protein L6164_001656 [Bauhinia variegata]